MSSRVTLIQMMTETTTMTSWVMFNYSCNRCDEIYESDIEDTPIGWSDDGMDTHYCEVCTEDLAEEAENDLLESQSNP